MKTVHSKNKPNNETIGVSQLSSHKGLGMYGVMSGPQVLWYINWSLGSKPNSKSIGKPSSLSGWATIDVLVLK